MHNKGGIVISGILMARNEYLSKNGETYHSIDVAVPGSRSMINVSVTPRYAKDLKEGSSITIPVSYSEYNGRARFAVVESSR